MNRDTPKPVREALSREVGRGCPVPGCGSPYLEWHHFDPPWRVREHFEPEGMIALCSEHHPIADGGAWTKEQLHEFKRNGAKNISEVKGRFSWLRNKLLVVAGNGFYYETLTILEIGGQPIIWLRRDENGYLLLNIRMLTTSGEPRLVLEDNGWVEKGNPQEFECQPSGKLIRAKYSNGDKIKVEFIEIESEEAAQKRYPAGRVSEWNPLISYLNEKIEFPITAVEISYVVAGTRISFTPTKTIIGGATFRSAFSAYCGCAISL
ncbi:MAG TPA: hypothetical protein VF648_01180 [Pyrinomonadaceae bacterium]|jgi:hypothetical protein